MEPTFFRGPEQLRRWFARNHSTKTEIWVGYYKKDSGKPSITWPESVDEALCFGWIDGIRRRIDDESYSIRFTPRRTRSIWSAVNIRRAGELIAEAPSWRRAAVYWVTSAKQPETRERRLTKLIEGAEPG